MAAVAVSLALSWLWRCENEGTIISGSDLHLVDSESRDSLIPLREKAHKTDIPRESLRHTCGGRVVPVAPHSVNSGPVN